MRRIKIQISSSLTIEFSVEGLEKEVSVLAQGSEKGGSGGGGGGGKEREREYFGSRKKLIIKKIKIY
jgi:hypothetical protein